MNRKKWSLTPMFLIFAVLMCLMSFISIRYNVYLFIVEFVVSLVTSMSFRTSAPTSPTQIQKIC